ncbi:endonuclease [Mycoplasmopsis felis]|uniref:endonuclease n=1 Tax=Mycoplasmopsis felis TaxID=33923 RepID=UPI002AFEBB67|nr:endonuclease [Mycoplasmopsis felis]WQQ04574.1 endonuclease [Mycoplasmopsis felis]
MKKIKLINILLSLSISPIAFVVSCKQTNSEQTPSNDNTTKVMNPEKTPEAELEIEVNQANDLDLFGIEKGNNIIDLISNELLSNSIKNESVFIFDRVGKKVLIQPKGTVRVDWKNLGNRSELDVFSTNLSLSSYQLANAKNPTYINERNQQRISSFIDYEIMGDFIEFEYKIALFDKGNISLSNLTFKSKFDLKTGAKQTIKVKYKVKNQEQETTIKSSVTTHINPSSVNESNYVYDANNNYYASANGLYGLDLWKELNKIQKSKRHSIKSYNDLPTFYNNSSAFKDNYYEKDGSILDIYSENPEGNDPYIYTTYKGGDGRNEGSGTNREHVIPQSWFSKVEPLRNDPTFVWPSDIKVNAVRANFPHDDVTNITSTSQNGSKSGTNSLGEKVFEVIDAFKGDIARAYLYFASSYFDKNISNGNSILTDVFPNIKEHYLLTYLNWNSKDPVDMFDINRNNETFKETTIRNPFIDYPNLASSLFGQNPKPFENKGVLINMQ